MFRFSLGMFALGVLAAAAGVLVWVASGRMPSAVIWGLLIIELAALSAYKVLLSTARILDRRERCPHA